MRGGPGRFSTRRWNTTGWVMTELHALTWLPPPSLHRETDQPALEMARVVGHQHDLVEADLEHLRARHAGQRRREPLHRDPHDVLHAGDAVDASLDRAPMQRLAERPFVG